ncbi:ABC transporter ATP-binding protein [Gleimia sp. 6138-11-ORH1]|uniref:ABC transporter ATP-binding protein n=1 Tax=Gleimia sp. 6138-11-ORH1 TaxID=2973937 RepID=UPI002168156E|nr:ABC transporter ATP-binding protein [Gleimia sp. 6138-11-ORH1]MCS4484010.1 ABC transporter ATP-binding protein [Gleimia sp. 6138-11-ORH1]
MKPIIRIKNLRKEFGTRVALKIEDLTIMPHETVAIIGPNGAGKTTFLRIVSSLWVPTLAETLCVAGIDLLESHSKKEMKRWRSKIGFASNSNQLFGMLTVQENLEYVARLYSIPRKLRSDRINEVLSLCGITNRADDQVWKLSTGLKQRVNIARALITRPQILFLDEPTTGLDPLAAADLYDVVRGLSYNGTSVIICTHLMSEVDDLCDRALFMSHGELVANGSPGELRKMAGDTVYSLTISSEEIERVRLRAKQIPGCRLIIRQSNPVTADVLIYGVKDPSDIADFGNAYSARKPLLSDTFFLLGGNG